MESKAIMGFNAAEEVLTMPYANYTPEEVEARGEAIYASGLRLSCMDCALAILQLIAWAHGLRCRMI